MRSVIEKANKIIANRLSRRFASTRGVPIISFSFDDFPRSALTSGGAILEDKGFRGTYYASMGLIGKKTSVGEMFHEDDLVRLVANGHELACHTHDHVSSGSVSGREFGRQCARNRMAVSSVLGGYEMCNFSFPSGSVTLGGKLAASKIYDTCRTTDQGINTGRFDLTYLRAIPVYSSRPIKELERMISENVRRAGWAHFYTHDVCENPSPFGCTPAYFREVLSLAVASGAEILTVMQAVDKLRGNFVYPLTNR